jgi:glycosyltransferase involved in cell wall biosynthesis
VILFDLSRLISRADRETPTGIDRVELAYAQHLIGGNRHTSFTMLTGLGRFGLLPRAIAEAYVQVVAETWRGPSSFPGDIRRARRLARRLRFEALCRGERALHAQLSHASGRPVYLLVSHHHLEKRSAIARLRQRGGMGFVCLVHDLIPIEFPEYALPGQADKHRRRIETVASLADAVIVNSTVTRKAFEPYLASAGRAPPVLVAPFGVDAAAVSTVRPPSVEPPYFVCVSTIEARKNHLLLLNLWRQLADELGEKTPRLVLVGQRGWETENAIDMLERCPALHGLVLERTNLSDAEVARQLQGARALLLPSFAEGFGFPLVEALALGVPVLCSDLQALRENGGRVPEYLDPLDGPGWRAAILDYSFSGSSRRDAQLSRLIGWAPPGWKNHFAAVEALIAEVRASQRSPSEVAPAARLAHHREPQIDRPKTADLR